MGTSKEKKDNDVTPYQLKLKELRKFLAEKRKLSDLAKSIGVSTAIVHETFRAKSPDEITGEKINVLQAAKAMKKKIEGILDVDNYE